jgi:class 3 adenylate cyclase
MLRRVRRGRGTTELVTVLFTDIVSSTQIAEEVGDRRWRALVAAHHGLVRQALRRHHGRELDTAGDGFFASFGRPADAIRCAAEVSEGVHEFGLEVRAGIHLGEAEVMGPKVGGVVVNTAARIMALGKGGEVLVSATVRESVAGKGIVFVDHGVHELKGLEGAFQVYDVATVDGVRRELPLEPDEGRRRRELPPAEPSRRAPRWLIPAGAVVLVAAGVSIALSLGGDDAADPTSVTGASGVRAMTEADEQVITIVPESFGDSCVATEPLPPGAVGAVTCTQGEYAARYETYANRDDLARAFGSNTAGQELTGTSCRDDAAASGFYAVDGADRGAVACFIEHPTPLEFVPTIVWTDQELLVLGRLTTEFVTDYQGNVPDLSFYEWWRTSAGPGPNRNFRVKDEPAELPSGTYRSTITRAQAGPLNEGGADDRWVGTWTITLDGDSFEESFDDGLGQREADQDVTGDQSYRITSELLWGKDRRMVLRRDYEDGIPPLGGVTAFCERLTESLGLRVQGDRLVFVDPSPGDACDDFRGVATFQPWERVG